MTKVDQILSEFEKTTASARLIRPKIEVAGRSPYRAAVAAILVAAMVLGVGFIALNTRVPQPPVAVASPSTLVASMSPANFATPSRTPKPSSTAEATPEPSASATRKPGPRVAAFRGWAPDGQHLLVDTAPNGGQSVLDLNGDEVLHVHGWDVAWVDSSTIAVVGDQTNLPVRTATLYDLSGAQVGQIAGEFEEFLFAPGHRVATGRSIANGNELQGGRYEIWDGAALSDWHDGIPVAWSPDASKLAIVHPNGTPYRPGVAGSLAIVDAAGRPLLAVADWVTGTTWQQLFSPDGRYLAACLWRSGSPEEIAVVNVESGEVQKVANGCGYLMEWTSSSIAVPLRRLRPRLVS